MEFREQYARKTLIEKMAGLQLQRGFFIQYSYRQLESGARQSVSELQAKWFIAYTNKLQFALTAEFANQFE